MTTIHIEHDAPAYAEARLHKALDKVVRYDPNWNGAQFVLVRDDHTWIDTDDELAGTQLLHEVVYPALKRKPLMKIDYNTAKNEEIEVRVDLERPESVIQYRCLDDEIIWVSTPFQRADVTTEEDALVLIDNWLGD